MKTPKQQAQSLIDLAMNHVNGYVGSSMLTNTEFLDVKFKNAKKLAKDFVDEIVKHHEQFWTEVASEIESFKLPMKAFELDAGGIIEIVTGIDKDDALLWYMSEYGVMSDEVEFKREIPESEWSQKVILDQENDTEKTLLEMMDGVNENQHLGTSES